jgi:hypothetical protein
VEHKRLCPSLSCVPGLNPGDLSRAIGRPAAIDWIHGNVARIYRARDDGTSEALRGWPAMPSVMSFAGPCLGLLLLATCNPIIGIGGCSPTVQQPWNACKMLDGKIAWFGCCLWFYRSETSRRKRGVICRLQALSLLQLSFRSRHSLVMTG